jgi:predicted PurR-regulated permease PerM
VPRVISFIVLLAIVLLVGSIFFQVMAKFLVPLFLAAVLLVVFQPLHAWTLKRVPGHPRICAAITTMLILLAVLLPLIWLGLNAYTEFHRVLSAPGSRPTAAVVTEADGEAVEAALADRLKKGANDLLIRFQEYTHIPIGEDDIDRLVSRATSTVGAWLLSGVQTAIGLLVGLAIMIIALYYFLVDGPGMIRAVMHLSPLEEHYEQELLERFGQVSRTVVVATLLSAVIQGSLAGIGYYFALPQQAPIFLLTALTMVTAMVPFVGAAAMWLLVCGWVYLYGERIVDGNVTHDGDPKTAIILAIYCTIVVSGIDNVIKPFVLHGQSKLHPLLALLSILGGVQVLGPVGILVGPMLVSFLQALLDMLRKELDSFSEVEVGAGKQLAAIVDAATPNSAEHAAAVEAGAAVATPVPPDPRVKTAPVPAKLRGRRVPPRKRGR